VIEAQSKMAQKWEARWYIGNFRVPYTFLHFFTAPYAVHEAKKVCVIFERRLTKIFLARPAWYHYNVYYNKKWICKKSKEFVISSDSEKSFFFTTGYYEDFSRWSK